MGRIISELDTVTFGGAPDVSDALLALALEGRKTATCWAAHALLTSSADTGSRSRSPSNPQKELSCMRYTCSVRMTTGAQTVMDTIPAPSESELEVMKAFWRLGPMSAREAHDAVTNGLNWAPSTTRTVLERMCTKGLLIRTPVHGIAVYAAARDKVSVLGGALNRLFRTVLEVRGDLPASAFAGSQLLSARELEELDRLLNEAVEGDQ
jgi:BlaI family penicillinase repressor